MAKAQTFGDKFKKKSADTRINIKVIKGYNSERGTLRFVERFIKINDLSEVETVDITK